MLPNKIQMYLKSSNFRASASTKPVIVVTTMLYRTVSPKQIYAAFKSSGEIENFTFEEIIGGEIPAFLGSIRWDRKSQNREVEISGDNGTMLNRLNAGVGATGEITAHRIVGKGLFAWNSLPSPLPNPENVVVGEQYHISVSSIDSIEGLKDHLDQADPEDLFDLGDAVTGKLWLVFSLREEAMPADFDVFEDNDPVGHRILHSKSASFNAELVSVKGGQKYAFVRGVRAAPWVFEGLIFAAGAGVDAWLELYDDETYNNALQIEKYAQYLTHGEDYMLANRLLIALSNSKYSTLRPASITSRELWQLFDSLCIVAEDPKDMQRLVNVREQFSGWGNETLIPKHTSSEDCAVKTPPLKITPTAECHVSTASTASTSSTSTISSPPAAASPAHTLGVRTWSETA